MLRQFKKSLSYALSLEEQESQYGGISLEYSFEDLDRATGSFSEENKLGAGAAGAVYRGFLRGGTEVAVKVLQSTEGSLNGFEDELCVLSRFRHPNLVTLLGWGRHRHDAGTKYLVYELLTGGDVEKRLLRSSSGEELFSWQQRLRVALDAACGLSYMVNSEPKAFHRDIKPPNILLDANGAAKMADFGLSATIKKQGQGHLTVQDISGTPGYADPRYIQSGKVTEASEVYSFGTVLLELLINERPALSGPRGEIIYPLVQMIQPAAPGAFERIVERLDANAAWPRPLVDEVSHLALKCVSGRATERPTFEKVVEILRRLSVSSGSGGAGQAPTPQTPERVPRAPTAGGRSGYGGTSPRNGQPFNERCGGPGGYPSPDGLARPKAKVSPSNRGDGSRQVAEVVLDAVHADGVQLNALPPDRRAIAFAVDPQRSGAVAAVGRQHQPELFETLVPKRERLGCISRAHFELLHDFFCGGLLLKQLSSNTLTLDDRRVAVGEELLLRDGSRIAFNGVAEDDPAYLVLRVGLRTRAQVNAEGHHPALLAERRRQASVAHQAGQVPAQVAAKAPAGCAAALECVHAQGSDPASLPAEARAIPISVDETVEVGRQHQLGFFERLLKAEPQWLSFISRSHLRISLVSPSGAGKENDPRVTLRVENLSANVVLVSGKPLAKGQRETVMEGGAIVFLAKLGDAQETQFLRFTVRRARGQRDPGVGHMHSIPEDPGR